MKVYVDTNSWLRCAAWRIDIWKEAQRIVPGRAEVLTLDKVMGELEGLKAAGGMLAQEAKLAVALIKQKNVPVVATQGARTADDALLQVAQEPDFVLTQDQALKRLLKGKGIGVIVIRGQDHLEIENK